MAQPMDPGERALAGPAAYGESQPILEFILTIARYLPLIGAVAALAAAGMYVITTPEPPSPTATSQVGLTQQVVWPFYDTARTRAVTTLEQPDFVEQLTERVGGGPLELTVDAPESQAFILISVTAPTPARAAAAADEAARLLLERDEERIAAATRAEYQTAKSALDASQARVADLQSQIDRLVPIEAEARVTVAQRPLSQEARETQLSTELERTSLTQALNEELRLQVNLQIDADAALTALDGIVPELELLSLADPPDEVKSRSLVPVIAAALAAAILCFAGAIVWDRSRGQLTSRWHAEQVAGVPVLADLGPRRTRERSVGLFLTMLLEATSNHGNVIAVTGLRGTDMDRWLAMTVQYFELAGIRVVAMAEPTDGPVRYGKGSVLHWNDIEAASNRRRALEGVSTITLPSSLTLLDATFMRPILHDISSNSHIVLIGGGIVGDQESDQALALADATVLVARRNVNRVDQIRRAARQIRSRKTAFLGMVIAASRLPTPQSAATLQPPQPVDGQAAMAEASS